MSEQSLTEEEAMSLYNGAYGYAGWPKAAADADFQATGGAGKGAGSSSGGGFSGQYTNMQTEIDAYVQDLKDFAKEDYDFAAKWLENQYKIALGSDDAARISFLEQVANELERQIGTIAWDYKTQTYRTEKTKEIALSRLEEDERVAREQLTKNAEIEREQQGGELNERGLLYGTREEATGLAAKNVGRLEGDITNRFEALERSVGRSREDIERGAAWSLEDLATTARRGATEEQYKYDYGKEDLERRKKRQEEEANILGGNLSQWAWGNVSQYG